VPLAWLIAVTFTACWHKIFDPNPKVGFLAQAHALAAGPTTTATTRLILNNRMDAAVTAGLVMMVTLVLFESARQWIGILSGRRESRVREVPFVMTRLAEESL
jgi:carbon starvation protein